MMTLAKPTYPPLNHHICCGPVHVFKSDSRYNSSTVLLPSTRSHDTEHISQTHTSHIPLPLRASAQLHTKPATALRISVQTSSANLTV
ncbi:hypothetical protein VTK56DRAFT_2206 [Thermocarpiscus australiensis]